MAKNDIDPAILKSYVEAERKRKILASDAEQQEKLVKVYKDQILAWLNSKGQNTARRAGYTVSISDGPKYPKWKDAFLEANGDEAVKAVIDATPASRKLTVVTT